LGRSDGRRAWTSYADSDKTHELGSNQFGLEWKWGGEVSFGRRFCCADVPYAVEATYWTTEPFSGYQAISNPGGYVSTSLGLQSMLFVLPIQQMMLAFVPAESWFMDAQEQRVWRRDEFHNLEINVIGGQWARASGSPWEVGWSAGLRYFRFQEDLRFGSLRAGSNWGDNGGADEAYLSDNITNNLFGVQCGFDVAYDLYGVRMFLAPKIGVYNNYLDSTFQARTGNGVDASGPYGSFPVHSTRNGLAWLAQIDTGAEWQFARNWSVRAGYRVVAVAGMGLADDQFPQYIVDTPEIADIQHSGSLVLHGAFAGATYRF
jgi:hypothetical protein